MAASTRFATGVHTLVLLAGVPDGSLTSNDIAGKLNANPVVIRRVLAMLQQAGLIANYKGPNGGSRLARPAKSIGIGDIYRALESPSPFRLSEAHGARLNTALGKILADAQVVFEAELNESSIAQLAKRLAKEKK